MSQACCFVGFDQEKTAFDAWRLSKMPEEIIFAKDGLAGIV